MTVARHDGFLRAVRVSLNEQQAQISDYTFFYAGHESFVVISQMDDL